jgi:TonB family protein
MRPNRYILPFLISLLLHILVFAASPNDLLKGGAVTFEKRGFRLSVIAPLKDHQQNVAERPTKDQGAAGRPSAGKGARESAEPVSHENSKAAAKKARTGGITRTLQTAVDAIAVPREPMERVESESVTVKGIATATFPPPQELVERASSAADPPAGGGGGRVEEPSFSPISGERAPRVEKRRARQRSDVDWREAGSGDRYSPPVISSMPEPEYPDDSRIHGEEGVVTLSVAVDRYGRGLGVEVVRSSGYGRLDRAAIDALEKARFLPAKERGEPVPSVKKIAVRFSLKDSE